jgi:hypothetical protein
MMPEAFERCRRNGGKIRTVSGPNIAMGLKKGQYKRICILNKKVFHGHTETKKD